MRIITFPEGFLQTLSDKTRKELVDKAREFEHRIWLTKEQSDFQYPRPDGFHLNSTVTVLPGLLAHHRNVYVPTSQTYIIEQLNDFTNYFFTGFTIIDDVPNKFLNDYIKFRAKAKELDELKASLEKIKN